MALNRKISVLIDGYKGQESYSGTLAENGKDHIIIYIMGGSGTYSLQDVEKKELLGLAYNKFSLKDLENKLGTKFDLM